MPPRAQIRTKKPQILSDAAPLAFAAGRSRASLFDEEATNRMQSFLLSLPDPDDTLKCAGLTRMDLRRLEKDDEVTQCMAKRIGAVVGTPWRLEPNETRISKFLFSELEPHIEHIIRGALESIFYGYSVQEVIFRKGSRIGIDRIERRPFEWFFFGQDGTLRFRPNDGSAGVDGIVCDPRKYILARHEASTRNPYGEAILSRLWWPVYYRAQLWRFRMQYLERFGMPITVGKTAGDKIGFAHTLSQLASNSSVAVDIQDDVAFVEAASNGDQFSKTEAELCARIQKLILGQTLTSQVGERGSYAAANVHYEVMQDQRNADIRMVTRAVQQLVDTLAMLNGMAPPRFVMADDTGLEKERAERDKILVEAGMLKLSKSYLLDRYDFVEGDFEIVEATAPAQQEGVEDTAVIDEPEAGQRFAFAGQPQRFTPQQQAIEEATDRLLEQVPEPLPTDALLAAVKAATDPADLAVRLSLLLDDADPRFAELLARAQFAAQTLGYVVAEQEAPSPPSTARREEG